MPDDRINPELKEIIEDIGVKASVKLGVWLWGKGQSAVNLVSSVRKSLSAAPGSSGPSVSRLLIIGSPGAGKTTTGKLLAGEYDDAMDIPGAYQESLGVESYALRDAPEVQLTVPPGQPHRRYYWDPINAEVASGKYDGIILLNSYGYHSIGEFDPLKGKGITKTEYLATYLENARRQEILVLEHLLPFLNANKRKAWLLHLVSKQDLWWGENQTVMEHYLQGEYGKTAKQIRSGDPGFKQEFAFGSIVISNFSTSTGRELVKTAAGYDQQHRVNSMRRFWEVLGTLQERSEL
jgi:hypothetical protein